MKVINFFLLSSSEIYPSFFNSINIIKKYHIHVHNRVVGFVEGNNFIWIFICHSNFLFSHDFFSIFIFYSLTQTQRDECFLVQGLLLVKRRKEQQQVFSHEDDTTTVILMMMKMLLKAEARSCVMLI